MNSLEVKFNCFIIAAWILLDIEYLGYFNNWIVVLNIPWIGTFSKWGFVQFISLNCFGYLE